MNSRARSLALLLTALSARPAAAVPQAGGASSPDRAFATAVVDALARGDSAAFEPLLPVEEDVRWYIANRVPRTVVRDDPATFSDPAAVHTELVEQLRADIALWREIAEGGMGLPVDRMRYLEHGVVADPIPDEFQSHVFAIAVALPFPSGGELVWDIEIAAMEVGGRFVATFWFPEYDGFLERKTELTDDFVRRVVPALYTDPPGAAEAILPDDDDLRWWFANRLPGEFVPRLAEFGLASEFDRDRMGDWLEAWELDPPELELERLRARVAELASGRRVDDARPLGYCLPLAEGHPLFTHDFRIEVLVLYDTGEEVPYTLTVGAVQGEEALSLGIHPEGAGLRTPVPGRVPCPTRERL